MYSHASIDAELRDWDVLSGARIYHLTKKRRSLFFILDRLPAVLRGKMKRAALALAVVYAVVLSSSTLAQNTRPVDTMPLGQIHAGMRGVAYTVFQGTQP